ncbi:hypothetical protein NCS56_01477100 [Fusarium sp. Ph1]|nr:hypothetical protein NCS56_01477100 [Fusarium sp. Ph1]
MSEEEKELCPHRSTCGSTATRTSKQEYGRSHPTTQRIIGSGTAAGGSPPSNIAAQCRKLPEFPICQQRRRDPPPGWVSKTDRHRQLINANVYEKETQNRAKAIEQDETAKDQRPSGNARRPSRNELSVEGIQFRVVDGGKKLVKVLCADAPNAFSRTPKSAIIAGVKFYRTKTGNLVANRVVNDQRRSGMIKKINEPCKIFSTTGNFSFRTWSDSNAVSLDLPGAILFKGPSMPLHARPQQGGPL